MRKLIKITASYISKINNYTEAEEEQIEYALRILIFETLKLVGTIIIFSFTGYPVQAILASGTMAASKPFIGGYHEDTQIKCFLATLLIVGSIVYLSVNLNMDLTAKLILSGISLYCIWNQAPVINPKMNLTRQDLIDRNRKIGLFIVIICMLLSLVFYKYKAVSDTILWTIVFMALLMFNKRELKVLE